MSNNTRTDPLAMKSEEEIEMKFPPLLPKKQEKVVQTDGDGMSHPVKIICQFCHQPSTLCIGGRFFLCASKTVPGLKICNACKSYEYRYKRLVPRTRKGGLKRKNGADHPMSKRQFFSPNSLEVDPSFDSAKSVGFRSSRCGNDFCKKKTLPQILPKIPAANAKLDTTAWAPQRNDNFIDLKDDMPLDIDESDCENDLQCDHCDEFISDMSNLVMCADCDKIYHVSCLVSKNQNFDLLDEPSRPVVVHCRDHCCTPAPLPVKSPKLTFGMSDLTHFDFPSRNSVATPNYHEGMTFEKFLYSLIEAKKRMQKKHLDAVGASFILNGY